MKKLAKILFDGFIYVTAVLAYMLAIVNPTNSNDEKASENVSQVVVEDTYNQDEGSSVIEESEPEELFVVEESKPEEISVVEESELEEISVIEESKPEEIPVLDNRYQASELYVLDGEDSSIVSNNTNGRYYFLMNTGEFETIEVCTQFLYKDIYNDEAEVTISEDKKSGLYFVPKTENSQIISFVAIDNNASPLIPLEQFLIENGLESFVNEDAMYSLEDIDEIKAEVILLQEETNTLVKKR